MQNTAYLPKEIISISENNQNIIKGLVLKSNNILPAKEELDTVDLLDIHSIPYPKITIDLLKLEQNNLDISNKITKQSLGYKIPVDLDKYLKLFQSIEEGYVLEKIPEINLPDSKLDFRLKFKILDAEYKVVKLVLEPINSKYLVIPVLKQDDIIPNTTEISQQNIENKLINYQLAYIILFHIWKFSKGTLNVLPMRFVMKKNKYLIGYILENGYIIHFKQIHLSKLHKSFFPLMNKRRIKLSSDTGEIYQKENKDLRIITVEDINYEKKLYKKYTENISKFININSRYNKNYLDNIKNIINNIALSNNSKRSLLKRLIDTISKTMIVVDSECKTFTTHLNDENCQMISNKNICSQNKSCCWVKTNKHIGSKVRKQTNSYKIFSKNFVYLEKKN